MNAASDHIIQVPIGSYIEAVNLSHRFNVHAQPGAAAAGARPQVTPQEGYLATAAVIEKGADMLSEVAEAIAQGAALNHGSAWHGPDLFLDSKRAQKIARSPGVGDGLGDMSIGVKTEAFAKLNNIAAAFNLSVSEATRLVVHAYSFVQDGLWRGNGFSLEKGDTHTPASLEKFGLPAYKR